MKRFLALFLTSVVLSGTCVFGADTARFVYNGKEVSVSSSAIFKEGYTYLPAAPLFKALGYHVIEKTSNNSVTAEVRGKSGYVSVFLGKQTGRMNGQDIHLGKAPFAENGVMYVSSALVEEQLGVKVVYDSTKNTVYINSVGEGKITSTVSKAPAAKKSASTPASTKSSAKSAGEYTLYPDCKYVPDFAALTGCEKTVLSGILPFSTATGNKHYVKMDDYGRILGMEYSYGDADKDDAIKYVNALESLKFEIVSSSYGIYVFKKGDETVRLSQRSLGSGYVVTVLYGQ